MALLFWGAASRRLRELALPPKTLLLVAVTGVLMATSWLLHFAAIPRTSIGVSTVVFHLQPFWLMGLSAWFLKEKISQRQILYALLAFGGLILATGLIQGIENGSSLSDNYITGLIFSLSGSVAFAFVTLLAKTLKRVSSFALTWWQCLTGICITAWWPIIHGWPEHLSTWGWLMGLGT
ncbi:TPA: DMT family transporter [Citrobacter freundii]|nr:DMT family transporter [Citrobacter freundii]